MRPTIINVYLIDCHGEWALVDTGMNTEDSFATLKDAFAQVGTRVEDLNLLIGTHHHVDHFGTSGRIKKISGARTLLHEFEVERVNRMLTMYFGPDTVLLAMDLRFRKNLSGREMEEGVKRIEKWPDFLST